MDMRAVGMGGGRKGKMNDMWKGRGRKEERKRKEEKKEWKKVR
jgi:hypothetical protein